MASKDANVAQAFKNNRQLQQFVLTGVTPTGKTLGSGSYGSVEEVQLMLTAQYSYIASLFKWSLVLVS